MGKRRLSRAFTLLEILVSVAVLATLLVFVAQVMSGATKTTNRSRVALDTDSEARTVFDRMALDIARMLKRKDVDFLLEKDQGNDELYFFSEAPASPQTEEMDVQTLALVGYRVNTKEQLERLGLGLTWQAAPPEGPVFLSFPAGSAQAVAESTIKGSAFQKIIGSEDRSYHVLGENIFRFEVSFLLRAKDGKPAVFSPSPFRSVAASETVDNSSGQGWTDVQAIVVTIAILDASSRLISGEIDKIISKFPDAAEGETPVAAWQKQAEDPSGLGIPASAASSVRVYQRIFPLQGSTKL